jgi:hypothetical protein
MEKLNNQLQEMVQCTQEYQILQSIWQKTTLREQALQMDLLGQPEATTVV